MLKSLMLPPYPSLEQVFSAEIAMCDSELYFTATYFINDYEICHQE
jgi:hypothetical protein